MLSIYQRDHDLYYFTAVPLSAVHSRDTNARVINMPPPAAIVIMLIETCDLSKDGKLTGVECAAKK